MNAVYFGPDTTQGALRVPDEGQAPVRTPFAQRRAVEGGPFKQAFFTWFQPVVLLAMIAFWTLAPDKYATVAVGIGIGIVFKLVCLGLEWVSERHASWRLTWKELVTDLFYVAISMTLIRYVAKHVGSDPAVEAIKHYFNIHTAWAGHWPLLVQVLVSLFVFDFGQYWMHRAMHNWHPLWLSHAPHHFITQLNTLKGAIGNPTEIFLIGLGIEGFFDFIPRAGLAAGGIGMAMGIYSHANIRFNSPRWWMFLFNTVEHHSLHHSQDYESTRCNYANTFIFIDRMFGTCVDGEAELVGQEGGRRMSIREQMLYPVLPLIDRMRAWRSPGASAVPAE
jgi:sterol desaturase/sphingolipid hydroxylase (fatty acid hydroxylase superfamily)